MSTEIKDNTKEVLSEIEKAYERALTRIGLQAESFAKQTVPVDTGRLRNSITNEVEMKEKAVYIGTNVEYAPYVELGARGRKPKPYLRPAATEHTDVYQRILESELKGK